LIAGSLEAMLAFLAALDEITDTDVKALGEKSGRKRASQVKTGFGRRFAVISSARLSSIVARADNNEWLCCNASSIA
jgi:hypothetical protein